MRRGIQTIESGWQEYRDLYRGWVPHLFVYYTTNGYSADDDNIGGYNQDVDGWIQNSNTIYPGAVSSPNSVRGGAQYVMFIKYQLYRGN
jgi:Neprosin